MNGVGHAVQIDKLKHTIVLKKPWVKSVMSLQFWVVFVSGTYSFDNINDGSFAFSVVLILKSGLLTH